PDQEKDKLSLADTPRAPDTARPLSLGVRLRRQALAPKGATLRASGLDRKSAAKQRDHHAMNADIGLLGSKKVEISQKKSLTREASYKGDGERVLPIFIDRACHHTVRPHSPTLTFLNNDGQKSYFRLQNRERP